MYAIRSYYEQHFAGMRHGEDLAAHYASADLFLFPSLSETYGNVVAEAMASGVPVVAYRSAAAAELVVDGGNGRVVAPGDEKAFVDAALWALEDGERLQRMGVEARQAMLARGWTDVVASFERAVREALARNNFV